MTREEMIKEVIFLAASPGPCDTPSELSWLEQKTLERSDFLGRASSDWLDGLLDLFVDSPNWDDPNLLDDWQLEIQHLIGDWARRYPDFVVPKVGKLLSIERARPFMIGTMAHIALPECFPWLAPLVDQVGLFSEAEICDLAAALGDSKVAEARGCLEQLQVTVPQEMQEAHHEIEAYIWGIDQRLAKQQSIS